MAYPFIDQMIARAIDPNDNTVTLTVRGEVICMPGIYMCADKHETEDPDSSIHTLKPYQGVDFITVPKKDIENLIKAIDLAADKYYNPEDPLESHRQLLGDDAALSYERIIDRAGFLTSPTSFYMEGNESTHEGAKKNVLG